MFLLKKIIAPFFQPILFCLSLLVLGLFFLIFTMKKRTGKVLVTAGTLVLALFSYDGVSDMLVRPLESQYPPISDFQAIKDVKWIVVLGGGARVDPALPLSNYLSEAALVRLVEGIRIHKSMPKTRLLFTGGNWFEGFTPEAKVMGDVAIGLGIKHEDIIVEPKAVDTKEHPIRVKEIIEDDPFILVTSASHMPRAVAIFAKYGMRPTPAPTDYLVMKKEGVSPGDFFPNADSLKKSGRSIHEYLGMAWAKLRSQI